MHNLRIIFNTKQKNIFEKNNHQQQKIKNEKKKVFFSNVKIEKNRLKIQGKKVKIVKFCFVVLFECFSVNTLELSCRFKFYSLKSFFLFFFYIHYFIQSVYSVQYIYINII